MDEYEADLAKRVYRAMMDHSNLDERSQQSAEFRFGVSDLGWCAEKSRRMLDRQVPEEEDALAAFIGTAIGKELETALLRVWPDAILQAEVSLVLLGETRSYTLPGHPDIIVPEEGLLLDGKTTFGLEIPRRSGASRSQQFQRHCYALAAWQTGLFGDIALDDVRVGNVWVDRSAVAKEVHVQVEPFDPDQVRAAAEWLDEVVYNYMNQQEAPKEPPREMCAVTCGFYRTCRAYDTDVEGLLTDQVVLTAVEMHREGAALVKQGNDLKKQASVHLEGISGSTGTVMVRWVHVNESERAAYTMKAYDRLDVKEIKK
jgi:hypothetical protein